MTSNGAKAIEDFEIGLIETGKKANFVVIKGDLKDSIKNVETVFKNGYGYNPNLILQEMNGKFGVE